MLADAEPIPTPPSPKPVFNPSSDVLKPNPHPYPIKTTSTGILSRSNSTTKSTSPYQFYVPQSPGSPSKDSFQQAQSGIKSARGDKERRGGRHRYSKSLNTDSIPSPLPVPPGFGSGSGSRRRSDSNSSHSSASSQSDVGDVGFSSTTLMIAESELHRKHRRSTLESPIVGSGTDVNDPDEDGGGSGRRRKYHTIGRRTGGKVKGMVASFERSGDEEDKHHTRHRSQSTGSSSSSSSSCDVVEKPLLYVNTPAPTLNGTSSDEQTMEQLLLSMAPQDGDESTSQLHLGTDPSTEEVETIKLRDVYVEGVHTPARMNEGDSTELTVEELLALTDDSGGGGADAWERAVGTTVKRIDSEVSSPRERVIVNGKSRRGKGSLIAKKEKETTKKLEDVFVNTDAKMDSPASSVPRAVSMRELKLEQEMSETREMVRALSARVANVEAKIGEMERVAGELEVRGRKLVEETNEVDEGTPPASVGLVRAKWSAAAASVMRAVVGVSRMVGILHSPFPSAPPSAPAKSKPPSREVSRTRGDIPLPYKKSWTRYLFFLGLGACALLLKEVVKKGSVLRGRIPSRG